MKTIKELKEAGKFVVEEWMNVYRSSGITIANTGNKVAEYTFEYKCEDDAEHLFISGNVFGTEEVEMLKPESVLFGVAKEETIFEVRMTTITGITFKIFNPKVRFI